MITIELSETEARIFRLLAESKALDIKNGSVTIHFDNVGNAAMVEVKTQTRLSPPIAPLTVVL